MQVISLLTLASLAGVNAYTEVSMKAIFFKNIDPVVLPGLYKSHMHTIFGSDGITANTNSSAELQKGCTSAENPNDLSTYWVPTLYYTGAKPWVPIAPFRFSAYYENVNDAEIPIPQNYKAVVGNSKATTQADIDPLTNVRWWCENDPPENKEIAEFPHKTCSTHLQTLLNFHDCVDPNDLTRHAYSGTQNWTPKFKPANRCPAGMKRIPRLRFSIRYDLRGVIKNGWNGPAPLALSSGNSYSAHGDFINGWLPEAAQEMLTTGAREFQAVTKPLGTTRPNCKPADRDPNHGTSDYATSLTMMGKRDETAVSEPVKVAQEFRA